MKRECWRIGEEGEGGTLLENLRHKEIFLFNIETTSLPHSEPVLLCVDHLPFKPSNPKKQENGERCWVRDSFKDVDCCLSHIFTIIPFWIC